MKSMRNERVDFGCCYSEAGNSIVVVGGRDNDLNILNTIEVYHVYSDNWFLLLEPLNIGYYKHAISFIDESEFIICGGLTEDNNKINKVRTIKIDFQLIKDRSN